MKSTWDSHHHGLAVVVVARPCCLAHTAVLPPLSPICVFLLRLFGSRRFCVIKTYSFSAMAIQLHLILPPIHHHLSFYIRLERERGRGEDCKDSMPGLRLKDSSTILVEHFFFFSSLFSL
uniref:Uncharacterized protein n=1 Tax=Opuntia streptacantha TaxID=393608 RepID=A0A7C9CHV7_OPUST